MRCDREKLNEYRRGELNPRDRADVEEHLRGCPECRVTVALDRLDPAPAEEADARAAFARFREGVREAAAPQARVVAGTVWRPARQVWRSTRIVWRPAAAAIAVAAGLVLVISYAPARQAVAGFLSIFRVREFSAITIDRARLDKLATLEESLRASRLVTPTTEREPAQPRAARSVSEARSIAGFGVEEAGSLPVGAQAQAIEVVSPGPAVRIDFDPARIEAQLAAAGITGIRLPPMQSGTVRGEVSSIVTQEVKLPATGSQKGAPSLRIVQATSPAVTLPPGADPKALGETYLEILGLPEREAASIASRIDWTGTLLIPMPAGLGTFREIEVGGAPGLYMEQTGPGERGGSVVVWQDRGVIRAVIGDRIAPSEMLRIAESMR